MPLHMYDSDSVDSTRTSKVVQASRTDAAYSEQETEDTTNQSPKPDGGSNVSFQAAIDARYARASPSLISLNPPVSSTSPSMTSPSAIPTAFTTLSLSDLPAILADPDALILDIRPHNSYAHARLPHALSLSVPSTLLKRPLFSLARLQQMIPSPTARARFARWDHASRIVVYDADASVLANGGNLLGLMRKFRNEGFPVHRDIAWLREEDAEHDHAEAALRTRRLPKSAFTFASTLPLVSHVVPPTPIYARPDPFEAILPIPPTPTLTVPPVRVTPVPPRAPALARPTFRLGMSGMTPTPGVSPTRPKHYSLPGNQVACNPFFDAIRQNLELAHGADPSEGIPLRLPRRVRRRVGELPFEWLRAIARRSGPAKDVSSETGAEGSGRRARGTVAGGAPATNRVGEQRRLMGVMERHSLESGGVVEEARQAAEKRVAEQEREVSVAADAGENNTFPFSITAGLEKGAKNRYRNIWPFEHARPLGTTKRYIATQGPLPETFVDFWTLCWEQNVRVIVMLTREVEGALTKCGKYWAEGRYGPLRLRLLETNDTPERERERRDSESGGFFSSNTPTQAKSKSNPKAKQEDLSTIRRVFELRHVEYPLAPSRIVTQLQYLEWPDMNVPKDPRGVLRLMRQVEEVVERGRGEGDMPWGEGPLHRKSQISSRNRTGAGAGAAGTLHELDPTLGVAKHALGNSPVLLHCSAGVGRTGGFIAVDAVLDGVRREMRKRKEGKAEETAAAAASAAAASGRRSGGSSPPNGTRSGIGSGSGSRSRSPESSGAEPMEVDSSPSPPPEAVAVNVTALTVPVSVGQNEVHVPVAGFTGAVPMQIDERTDGARIASPRSPTGKAKSSKHGVVPPQVLLASPALVEEVKRATLNRWPSMSAATEMPSTSEPGPGAPSGEHKGSSSRDSETSSDSYPVRSGSNSGSGFGSASAMRSRSRSSASPPTSQMGSSSTLSSLMARKTESSLVSPSPCVAGAASSTSPVDPRIRTFSLPSSMAMSALPPTSSHSSRLNTWRSGVRLSDSPPRDSDSPMRVDSLQPAVTEEVGNEDAPAGPSEVSGSNAEYSQPRRLHDNSSPPLLSTYDEPIRRVVEDMREQRMSLCQSLRQYVFVHRAIIEGALMIVDEEKERVWQGEQEAEGVLRTENRVRHEEPPVTDMIMGPAEKGVQDGFPVPVSGHGLGAPFMLAEKEESRKRSAPEFMGGSAMGDGVLAASTTSPGRPKRGASPTELLKEDSQGGVVLTKRPSLKRKQRREDEPPVQFKPIIMASPLQPPVISGPR
ncbi:Receptor-type tyrosine-protein phosphatase gamma [Grifola frondosa]|uniref:protein-tyrosine-phosphatase n=1 Tax=Grifola frondosa TaxID=5627 RepID=A0A1C7MQA4_GRIFR|nr:Receptor-type tyrosine-protein phosphatase gamma [Grifola frondosa]